MPGKKSSLADRYLAAIQGSDKDGASKNGASADGEANSEAGKKVKIEYTYRPPANADDADDKNGNTTGTGGGGGKTGVYAEDSNKRIAVNVFQTSSTEEETEDDPSFVTVTDQFGNVKRVSAYEAARIERIRRNNERLASLGLD